MLSNPFLQAKVDHYLQRAEEYMRMCRFLMAKQLIQKVLTLDPGNIAVRSLEKRVEYSLTSLFLHARGEGPHNDTPPEVGPRHRRGQLVMIVDQDERVLLALVERLRLHGFDVVCAAGYKEALDTLATTKPDVVVSEVNFENGPVGFDLYLWIRTNNTTADTPFLFLASRIERNTLVAGKRLGVDDFILKPLDEEVVTASVIQCLTRQKREKR